MLSGNFYGYQKYILSSILYNYFMVHAIFDVLMSLQDSLWVWLFFYAIAHFSWSLLSFSTLSAKSSSWYADACLQIEKTNMGQAPAPKRAQASSSFRLISHEVGEYGCFLPEGMWFWSQLYSCNFMESLSLKFFCNAQKKIRLLYLLLFFLVVLHSLGKKRINTQADQYAEMFLFILYKPCNPASDNHSSVSFLFFLFWLNPFRKRKTWLRCVGWNSRLR